MRMLADAMLGALARWLRAMGYDTAYDAGLSDHELVRLARREERILLTRDTGIIRRRNLKSLFISSESWKEQLRQVLHDIPLPKPQPFTRCLRCNDLLHPILRSEAWGMVPPYVFTTKDHFMLCPTCNKVYWRGTHREGMEVMVQEYVTIWDSHRHRHLPASDILRRQDDGV